MSTYPNFQTESEEDEFKKTYEKHKELIETLPKGRGWMQRHIFNYKGFWLGSKNIIANLLLNTHFASQPTDIFLASDMKSGTTWLRGLMFTTINRHLYDFSDHPLHHQSPQVVFPVIDIQIRKDYPITNFSLAQGPQPRLFATHFARTLLPPSVTAGKCVYVCRDPKDVLISKWLFTNKIKPKELKPLLLEEAFELFCQGVSEYGPIWDHVLGYWRASLEYPDKILFLKYEEIINQPQVEVKRLAEFMGMPFTVDEEEKGVVDEIVRLCSFQNLSNLEVNKSGVAKFGKAEVENRRFFRKGEIGDWKNYLSEEMKERIDRITNDKLKGSGLILGVTESP